MATAAVAEPEAVLGARLGGNLRRVGSLGELFGQGYPWDGSCSCGANDWRDDYWERGYSVHCRACGRWLCYHELEGVIHTREGLWFGRGRAKPPAGCALCQNARKPY
jgi:hypothetical protein